jgi:predicted metalloprotease
MQTEGREESQNVEDARGQGGQGLAIGGGLVGVVVVLLATLLGIDPRILQGLGLSAGGNQQQQKPVEKNPREEKMKSFTAVVLKDTETVWGKLLPESFRVKYREPKLKLFSGGVQSACGFAKSAVGPFYCPADERVYLDLSFFDELDQKLGAKGDFARAYVIAHEIGHHIQNLIGPPDSRTPYIVLVNNERGGRDANQLQVRLELQADFLAGVWAHHADRALKVLDPGDVEEALGAAQAVGDDTLQKKYQGYVRPDSFTHGSAKQRAAWFLKGYKTGDPKGMHELFTRRYETLDNP